MKALIGVMPEEQIRKRMLSIAKGECKPEIGGTEDLVYVYQCSRADTQQ
jgi:hypothetical protein